MKKKKQTKRDLLLENKDLRARLSTVADIFERGLRRAGNNRLADDFAQRTNRKNT